MEKFTDVVEDILQSPESEFFPEVTMRGIKGRGYFNKNYGDGEGFFVGINDEGEFKGQVKKAQSVSPKQYRILEDTKSVE